LEEGILRGPKLAITACLCAALSLGVVACGDDDGGGGGGSVSGNTLTIYSSLPLQGDSRPQGTATVSGEKLALEQAGNKVGKYKIKYVSLDDSTATAGKWEPGQTSANARKASQDSKTIAYLGEFNSGASAISIPILNQAGILQISPSNTYEGLTRPSPDKAEPDKYYPTGKRTYGRVVPPDAVQASAQVSWMKELGVKKLYILNDKEVYGKGIANQVATDAKEAGIQVLGNDGIDPKAANYRALATKIKGSGADAMFFGGIVNNNAAQLWKDVYGANTSIKLFGPDGVATAPFNTKIGPSQANTYLTSPTLDPKLYPPAAQKFYADYKAKYGTDQPDPYAIYGYEAMSAALQAIKDAGDKGNDRQAVIDAFYNIRNKESVLGTYSIDDNGDTSISDYGAYRVKGGKIVFVKVLKGTKS
jgi:branched-chain amino acid transport system substrate-binding protein